MDEDIIYIRDFPSFVKFKVDPDFREGLLNESLERVKVVTLNISPHHFWRRVEKEIKQSRYEFVFGRGKGTVIEALEKGPVSSKEILEKINDLSTSTIYHSLAKLKREGFVREKNGKLILNENGTFDNITVPYLTKLEDMANPGRRRKQNTSKKDIGLALYLWKEYEKVCKKENMDLKHHRYARTYKTPFYLAAAIYRWRKGKEDIPQWALLCIANLAQMEEDLNKEGIILNYHFPPGTRIVPTYNGEYKLPIKSGPVLDKVVIKMLVKGSGDGRGYNYRDRERFFGELRNIFGSFHSRGIPSVIVEILKKYYGMASFDRKEARIPHLIREKWEHLNVDERILHKVSILESVVELASRYDGQYEITSRSREFLEDVSRILEELGIKRLSIKKREDRPHYRSWISSKKISMLGYYRTPEEIYPDFEIWARIPLNEIRKGLCEDLNLKNLERAIEKSCMEELRVYVTSILKSIEKDRKEINLSNDTFSDYRDKITEHFWEMKKVPTYRDVLEYWREEDMKRLNIEKILYAQADDVLA